MARTLSVNDRRSLTLGAIVLAVVTVVYPLLADDFGRPLSAFVLPCLITAVIGGWRPTVAISAASLTAAVVLGIIGPLDAQALAARWTVIVLGAALGAVGAAVRETQAARLAEMRSNITLRDTFERALIPTPAPPPGVRAVVRYRPAEDRMELGGDFLEAIALPDGRLAVLIGDVCGHGPREAAFGAALRAGWKGIALNNPPDPVRWIDALDMAFFRDGRIDVFSTMCTGVLDVDDRRVALVSAGHPPPIAIGNDVTPLDLPPGPPIGIGLSDCWSATSFSWDGAALLFYTDGLIENPSAHVKPRRWGIEGLVDWLEHRPTAVPLESLADELMRAAVDHRDVEDDIATLLVAADGKRSGGQAFRPKVATHPGN